MTDQEHEQGQGSRGMPMWMPFAGLLVAFGFMVFAGTQIFPTLVGLVFPPEPPLPTDSVTLLEHTSVGPGSDQWRFSSTINGCDMAKYVQDRIGGCVYDMSSQCTPDTMMPGPSEGVPYPVARCVEVQTSGIASYRWQIQITTGYGIGEQPTRVLVYRDATNRN